MLPIPQTRVRAWSSGDPTRQSVTHNDALPWWGYALAKAVTEGGTKWRLRKVYIEFENVADIEDAAAIPTVDPMNPDHALPYYAALADSPSRDFLRVDISGASRIGVADGYADYFLDTEGGNLLLTFAQTAGTVGVHGLPFSAAAKSKVCGTALVVAPVEADPTQDIVVSRAYFAADEQIPKEDGQQVGVSCESPFTLE